MAINITTLFTRLGKIFKYQKAVNTARLTTLPPLAKDVLDQFNGESIDLKRTLEQIAQADASAKSGLDSAMSLCRTSAENIVIETVWADKKISSKTLEVALVELIQQMQSGVQSVERSAVSATPSTITGNGDAVLVATAIRGDGLPCEYVIAETLLLECTEDTDPANASFTLSGPDSVTDLLSQDWPIGSGSLDSVTVSNPSNGGFLSNGDFELETTLADAPDGWTIRNTTPGAGVKISNVEKQTITVSGTPTTGVWEINYTTPSGKILVTAPLVYNASETDVQAALQALDGLGSVTVTTTGTSPNYVHAIEFIGVAGNVTALTTTQYTDTGIYTVATVTNGDTPAFRGKSLILGSGLNVELYQQVRLSALQVYAFNLWAAVDVVPAAGVVRVALIDGISGTILDDQQGIAISSSFNASGLTTAFAAKNFSFSTPRILPNTVYLQIRLTTAVSGGTQLFLDDATLAEPTEIYADGPRVAIFSGKTAVKAGSVNARADYFTLVIANNRAGELNEYCDRNFALREKQLTLPSNVTPTQLDSLMA